MARPWAGISRARAVPFGSRAGSGEGRALRGDFRGLRLASRRSSRISASGWEIRFACPSLRPVAPKQPGAGGKKKLGAAASTKARRKPASTTTRAKRAAVIATRMPLVHYPVAAKIADWSTWPNGLMSPAARGQAITGGEFEKLHLGHVFFYAGPSCFHRQGAIGDAVLYFDPSAEKGQLGGASPFDSGALEGTRPRLRPWDQASVATRWKLFEQYAVTLSGWRADFTQWLAISYDAPDRYLDTGPNRWEAGQPDRLVPPEILEHNGARGVARYGQQNCADRRAWTWEIRIAGSLPFARVNAVHVPFRQVRKAYEIATRMRWTPGRVPQVKTLRRGEAATPDTLYVDSERVLRELISA